jgi:XTP/dITP diphosphohydrolase
MNKILILTRNLKKLEEYQRFFAKTDIELVSLNDVGGDFQIVYNNAKYHRVAEENATRAARKYHLPVISEIFGLEIPALAKWPGIKIYKLYDTEPERVVKDTILRKLRPNLDRSAFYVSGFAFAIPAGEGTVVSSVTTRLLGRLLESPIGEHGFGFDDLFYVTKYRLTLARVGSARKDAISHRFEGLNYLLPSILKTLK